MAVIVGDDIGHVVGRGHEVEAPAVGKLDGFLVAVVVDEFRRRRYGLADDGARPAARAMA